MGIFDVDEKMRRIFWPKPESEQGDWLSEEYKYEAEDSKEHGALRDDAEARLSGGVL